MVEERDLRCIHEKRRTGGDDGLPRGGMEVRQFRKEERGLHGNDRYSVGSVIRRRVACLIVEQKITVERRDSRL